MPNSTVDEVSAQQRIEKERGRGSNDLILDTAAVYTCSYEIADDYAAQCRKSKEEFEMDVAFTTVAHKIWQGRTGRGQEIANALAEFLTARQTYLDALTKLLPRLEGLIDQENHEHLEPIEEYRDLVNRGLFPERF